MTDYLFRAALDECKAELKSAVASDVPIDERALDDFAELFISDFAGLLSNTKGAAIWRRDGRRVRRLGRYIGMLAEFYATSGFQIEPIGRKHLMRALGVIQPECKLRASSDNSVREEYCTHVLVCLD